MILYLIALIAVLCIPIGILGIATDTGREATGNAGSLHQWRFSAGKRRASACERQHKNPYPFRRLAP
jgi:hypothetical protein